MINAPFFIEILFLINLAIICMAICPFSRPNRTIHKFVKFMLRRSAPARVVFPYIDNILSSRS